MKKSVNQKQRKPFIAYYRVSTKKQNLGLDAQKVLVKNYLKTKYPPDFEFIEKESGKRDDRPQLLKALELCKKHNGILIVAKLDRLSRDLHFITSLQKSKVKFVCCDMPDATPLTINIMGSLAQWEREQISKRTSEALQSLKKKGKKLGSNNPKVRAGLEKRWSKIREEKARERKELKKDKFRKTQIKNKAKKDKLKSLSKYQTFLKESQQVITIKKLRKAGDSVQTITNKLNELGIKSRFGKTWHVRSVHRIIQRLGL